MIRAHEILEHLLRLPEAERTQLGRDLLASVPIEPSPSRRIDERARRLRRALEAAERTAEDEALLAAARVRRDAELPQVLRNGLGDDLVRSIEWLSVRGGGLIVTLDPPLGPALQLAFEWVHDLRMDVDLGDYAGPPMLFSADFDLVSGERWSVGFDYEPHGSIRFECNDLYLLTSR